MLNIPTSHFYKYLQVRSYLTKTMGHNETLNDRHPPIKYINNIKQTKFYEYIGTNIQND